MFQEEEEKNLSISMSVWLSWFHVSRGALATRESVNEEIKYLCHEFYQILKSLYEIAPALSK